MELKIDHWDNQTLHFLSPVLTDAKSLVRIATGFFTVQGYDLVRSHLTGKHVQIMVGYDETSKERLRDKLIDDIMLHLSTWDSLNRREAVLAIVEQLQQGRLQVVEQSLPDILEARLRNRDHAKVFIVDDACVVVGSGNLTVSGLRYIEDLGLADITKIEEFTGVSGYLRHITE
jgi:phosphatidylserine/phosphatidylglycerophosphate/cardiolipin synthase-like enzyme